MRPHQASRTAVGAAALRAAHPWVDGAPAVFRDEAVLPLLPVPVRRGLERLRRWRAAGGRPPRGPRASRALRAQIVVRSRYVEDVIAAEGLHRVVVLGAGLDTTALRRPDLEVIELDHPASQDRKRTRLGRPPGNLRFLPVDFEVDDLATVLSGAVTTDGAPVLVQWLGCSYYLSQGALAGTLAALGRVLPAASRLVLDHWQASPRLGPGAGLLLLGLGFGTALQGEPLRSLLAPGDVRRLAAATGWCPVEALDAGAQNRRWLAGRADGLRVPAFAHLTQLELRAGACLRWPGRTGRG